MNAIMRNNKCCLELHFDHSKYIFDLKVNKTGLMVIENTAFGDYLCNKFSFDYTFNIINN
jgi:hypothetical protein